LTDGVLDARRGATEFGFDGVLEVLRGLRKWTPEEAAYECVEAVRRFADDLHRDDVTCVVLGRQDP
jgi:serine phosphatase RsbU (regulator of sigma subunit)